MSYFTDLAKRSLRKLPNEGYFIKQKVRQLLATKEVASSKYSKY
jgi:hypothetical protein